MKRKALALADSGIMPVSGKEKPGVLARQSSNSSSVLPFKKRLYFLAPIYPEYSFSNENESKTKDVVPVEDASQIDLLRKTSSSLDSKPPISSASVIGSNGDKGKQVVGSSKEEFNFPISSIHPALRHKSVDVLRFCLGSTLRGFDSLAKADSNSVGPNSSLLKNQALNRNMNSPTCKTVAGVLAGQSSNSSCVLPIKKRLCLHAPIHPERSFSNENECKTNAPIHPNASSGPSRNVDDLVKQSLAGQEAIGTTKVSVKEEVIAKQGKQVVGASELEFNFRISSIHPSLRHKSADVLRLSLGSTLREFESSAKVDSNSVSANSSLLKHRELDRNMDSSTCKTVESEPVVETLVQANAGTAVRPAGTFEVSVVKTEVVSQNLQSVAPQSARRVSQLQESSSSSYSTCSDLSVSGGDLSTPSEYSDHTNEADIAAKNANFDLKQLNVCSDKVEAFVSTSMNIEDQKVYKKTQDSHNLVASGEGSANNGEKISKSPGTEEKCYGSSVYESDGYHTFVGHVDTENVGCVREDDIYEDGEIREPMMQSIAEDSIYQGSVDQSGIADVQERSQKDVLCAKSRGAGRNVGEANNEYIGRSDMSPIALSSSQNAETPVYLRYFYMEEEEFHLRRNSFSRNERENIQDARHRFQDRSFGSSRGNIMRGRGRVWGRFHRLRRDWYSGRDFESYGGVADYRFRHNRTAAVCESTNERNDCDNRLDGAAFASNRRRNPLNDPLHSFRHPTAPPVRSRTWSLPWMRWTEGFNVHQDSFQHRSPCMYREDRMRSSPRTSFTEEAIAPQRRDSSSPSYTARRLNDMRDVNAVQEHRHPRFLSSRRSPPDQERADKRRKYGEGRVEATQMRNVEDQEDESDDVFRLKKRRF